MHSFGWTRCVAAVLLVVSTLYAQGPDQIQFGAAVSFAPGTPDAAIWGSCSVVRVEDGSASLLYGCDYFALMGISGSITGLSDGTDVFDADGLLREIVTEFTLAGTGGEPGDPSFGNNVYRRVGNSVQGASFKVADLGDPNGDVASLAWFESDDLDDFAIYFTVDQAGASALSTNNLTVHPADVLVVTSQGNWQIHASHTQLGLGAAHKIDALAVSSSGEIAFSITPDYLGSVGGLSAHGAHIYLATPGAAGSYTTEILYPAESLSSGIPSSAQLNIDGIRVGDPGVSPITGLLEGPGTAYAVAHAPGFLPVPGSNLVSGSARTTLWVAGRNGNIRRSVTKVAGRDLRLRVADIGAVDYAIYGYLGPFVAPLMAPLGVPFQPFGFQFPELGNPLAFCYASTLPGQGAVLAPPAPATFTLPWPATYPEVTWRVAFVMPNPPLGEPPTGFPNIALSNEITVRFF